MGLAETQKALARLYTDARLRERFFADPFKTGEEFGLGRDEAQQLARLSARQVNFFAGTLHAKRLQEVRDLLPLTFRALAERAAPLFREYAETNLPGGVKKHRADAAGFADYLATADALGGADSRWVADLARYEKTWLEAADMPRGVITRRFRFAVNALARDVLSGNTQPAAHPKTTLAIWFRLSPARRLTHSVLPLPF
jgi:hypothetical protein